MDQFAEAYRGKRVLVTGHTGFKGSWLAEWLLSLGADVWGLSLPPPTAPALFDQLGLASRINHRIADVRDRPAVLGAVRDCQPDFLFHLAAQPLVLASYDEPVETYATNVMGTVNVLEALRELRRPCAAVFVTSDKCYENRNRPEGYGEEDPLGGSDPYSSSKAAAEIAIASWRRSFFSGQSTAAPVVGIASARAGNVIGGGDWAAHRIMPDCIRSLMKNTPVAVRNPESIRPWQHVLEPLSGYLELGGRLRLALDRRGDAAATMLPQLCSAFNFGPDREAERPVRELVEELLKHWPGPWTPVTGAAAPAEAPRLHLRSEKAANLLGWKPRWAFSEAVARTAEWYRMVAAGTAEAAGLTRRQIAAFTSQTRN